MMLKNGNHGGIEKKYLLYLYKIKIRNKIKLFKNFKKYLKFL